MRLPSYNQITLGFGQQPDYPLNNGFHNGVDFANAPDRGIYAPESGRVTLQYDYAGSNDGNTVHLWVGNRHHAFCHMSLFQVSQNQQVSEGQLLGQMGDTGYAQGVHLHFALAVNSQLVDPLTLVTPGKGVIDMPDKIDLNSGRILTEEILGRDRIQTHSGAYDDDIKANRVGNDLTNQQLFNLWTSPEAQAAATIKQLYQGFYAQYRDSIGELSARPTRAELDAALTKLEPLQAEIAKTQGLLEQTKQENLQLKDQQTKEEEQGKSIFRVIAQLFSKSKK